MAGMNFESDEQRPRHDMRSGFIANDPVSLSELLGILSERRNRRIVHFLLQQDSPVDVDELTVSIPGETDDSPLRKSVSRTGYQESGGSIS
jgi:phosphoribosyl-dephospho-CoA transferase